MSEIPDPAGAGEIIEEMAEPWECAACPATFLPADDDFSRASWRAIPPGWGLIYGVNPVCSVACAKRYAQDHTASGRLGYNDVAWNGPANEESQAQS